MASHPNWLNLISFFCVLLTHLRTYSHTLSLSLLSISFLFLFLNRKHFLLPHCSSPLSHRLSSLLLSFGLYLSALSEHLLQLANNTHQILQTANSRYLAGLITIGPGRYKIHQRVRLL